MRRLRLWLPVVGLAGALAVGAAAAVAPSHTSPVTATLSAARVTMQETTCTGDDGQYRQARETYAGTLAGDPRMTGIAALYLLSLVNTTTGNGTTHGLLLVTDPSSHQMKVRAAFSGVVTAGSTILTGFMTGLVSDFGTQQGGALLANFQGVRTGPVLYAGIGSTGTNIHPAVIQRAHCSPASAGPRTK